MKLIDSINESVKNIFTKVPTLIQLQAEDEARKLAETLAEREAAHRELQEAREKYSTELPALEAQVALDRERVDRAKRELVDAEKSLAASSATRFCRVAELRGAIAACERRLRQSAPAELTEFLGWCLTEFEKLRLQGEHHISSGIDPSTGQSAVWVRSNARSITTKLDRIEAARKRALELQLELTDPAAEIEKLKGSIDVGGLVIEEIKGRLGEPMPPPYNRYEERPSPLPNDPPRREHW
jgi:hypothetical protein